MGELGQRKRSNTGWGESLVNGAVNATVFGAAVGLYVQFLTCNLYILNIITGQLIAC